MKTRSQFQELYNEMREHLSESYAEIDQLERDKQTFIAEKSAARTDEDFNALVAQSECAHYALSLSWNMCHVCVEREGVRERGREREEGSSGERK